MKKGLLILVVFFTLITVNDALAQGCAMCAKTAADLNAKSARGLNEGILYLAAIPVTFLSILGYIWYKKNNASEIKKD